MVSTTVDWLAEQLLQDEPAGEPHGQAAAAG
jgi:hypothetical protein